MLTLLLALTAFADIGPKPTSHFQWKSHEGVDQRTVTLLQCKDAACKQSEPLRQVGPQRFHCCDEGCFAMAYGFSEMSQLSLQLGGKKVLSAPFATDKPRNYFEISVARGKLTVKTEKSLPDSVLEKIAECR